MNKVKNLFDLDVQVTTTSSDVDPQ
ncbi:MAG: FDLD family class I lanthipeptide, partial [Bacillota bacterium]